MILFVGKDTTLFRSSSIRYRGWLYNVGHLHGIRKICLKWRIFQWAEDLVDVGSAFHYV